MNREKVDNNIEKDILIGMITSSEYIEGVKEFINLNYVSIPYAPMIYKWCITYYDKYETPIMEHIEDEYKEYKRKCRNKTQVENIGFFLQTLSRHYDKAGTYNAKYYIEKTKKYIKQKALEKQTEEVKRLIEDGQVEEAEKVMEDYQKVVFDCESSIEPLGNLDAFKEAFEEKITPLVEFGGALGKMINPLFYRGCFVSVLGRAKSGKTFWLSEIIQKGLNKRYNVAFFQAGDMTQNQWILRLATLLTGKASDPKYCGEVTYPIRDCILHQTGECEIQDSDSIFDEDDNLLEDLDWYKPCPECRNCSDFQGTIWNTTKDVGKTPLTWREALKKSKRFKRFLRGARFFLDTYANKTLTMNHIESKLKYWDDYMGFVPDIICIDYADIMADEDPTKDERTNENLRWQKGRRISQKYNCLLIMPTQSDANGYKVNTLGMGNFNSDRRKNDNITGQIGLNQTDDEKRKQITRINVILSRDGDFNESDTVTVLQSLARGKVVTDSFNTPVIKQKQQKEVEGL